MPFANVFDDDAFSLVGMTAAIETSPYKPRLLGSLGLFTFDSINTLTAMVERQKNTLRILNTANRGTVRDVHSMPGRDLIPVKVPHVPYDGAVIADEVQGIREFGSETQLETVAGRVARKLRMMKDDHEVTHEFHRIGALKGQVLDGDASTVLYNFYTIFGVSQTTIAWYSSDESFKPTVTGLIRTISDKLGADVPGRIIVLCGSSFFDAVTSHPSMLDAFERWRDGEFKRESYIGKAWYRAAAEGFSYQNVLFLPYRGKVGSTAFVADNEAYAFPTDIPDMLLEIAAPADFEETVNTYGKRYYARQEPMRFNKGRHIHTQSNVLFVNSRPDLVVKLTWAAEET